MPMAQLQVFRQQQCADIKTEDILNYRNINLQEVENIPVFLYHRTDLVALKYKSI